MSHIVASGAGKMGQNVTRACPCSRERTRRCLWHRVNEPGWRGIWIVWGPMPRPSTRGGRPTTYSPTCCCVRTIHWPFQVWRSICWTRRQLRGHVAWKRQRLSMNGWHSSDAAPNRGVRFASHFSTGSPMGRSSSSTTRTYCGLRKGGHPGSWGIRPRPIWQGSSSNMPACSCAAAQWVCGWR